jgi:glutaredoxin
VDSIPTLKAWAESLGGIHYPLLSDFYPHGAIAARYGVLRDDGTAERALFLVDKQGLVRYVDIHDIDDQPDNDVILGALRRVDPEAAARQAAAAVPPSDLPSEGIIVYCTSWCPACRRVRRFFNEHEITYTEIDINKTPEARERLRKLTGGTLTTPTFEINGQVVVDFKLDQRKRIEQMLGLTV